MTLAEVIYQRSLRLPEEAAREALDFIEFLEQRYGTLDSSESAKADKTTYQGALKHLAGIQVDWGGKPISSRDDLYDDVRGGT
ncbi:DUF2281 domain-containing protein [Lamprobacter modestohalophilus]|uniref:DUF2281 domain-containing protein n=1 Tax=Lamprobacter modestohalophilus TaxID=1064514 RepID=UPI002ADEE86E|nr:DUF2281 domain-containing protein [Lamprobacter modestohalophilus]MEA1052027.1 DUF2281 domain-containing protein [Lamprobacter modestohalophilus]MEA1052031.1 DUF2281 domain-containing protein [Lamprobacter modestohalophilus]MEA1053668.1 DUF2281 domain-containing protein [Lamprobacter modestohalophilus]